jgi:hypothetical protein
MPPRPVAATTTRPHNNAAVRELIAGAAAVHLGEGGAAIDTHNSLDNARAYIQIGKPHTAAQLLLAADQAAAPEVRDRPASHEVLAEVLRRTRTNPPAPIGSLAEPLCIVV